MLIPMSHKLFYSFSSTPVNYFSCCLGRRRGEEVHTTYYYIKVYYVGSPWMRSSFGGRKNGSKVSFGRSSRGPFRVIKKIPPSPHLFLCFHYYNFCVLCTVYAHFVKKTFLIWNKSFLKHQWMTSNHSLYFKDF